MVIEGATATTGTYAAVCRALLVQFRLRAFLLFLLLLQQAARALCPSLCTLLLSFSTLLHTLFDARLYPIDACVGAAINSRDWRRCRLWCWLWFFFLFLLL